MPPGIDEEDGDALERDELEAPGWGNVVARTMSPTIGTDRAIIAAWQNLDVKDIAAAMFTPVHRGVNETTLRLNPIQDRLEQHIVLLRLRWVCLGRRLSCQT